MSDQEAGTPLQRRPELYAVDLCGIRSQIPTRRCKADLEVAPNRHFSGVDPHQMSEPQLTRHMPYCVCARAEAVIPAKDQQLVSDARSIAGDEHNSRVCFTDGKPAIPVVRSLHHRCCCGHVDCLMKDRWKHRLFSPGPSHQRRSEERAKLWLYWPASLPVERSAGSP